MNVVIIKLCYLHWAHRQSRKQRLSSLGSSLGPVWGPFWRPVLGPVHSPVPVVGDGGGAAADSCQYSFKTDEVEGQGSGSSNWVLCNQLVGRRVYQNLCVLKYY